MMQKEYGVFPTPQNFNYFWNFGALAMVTLVVMILTGIFLAMNYQPNTAPGVRQRAAHHARRELRLADPLRAPERRVDVLHRHVHPYFPRRLLRVLQGAARAAVDPRRGDPAADDGHRVHGLRAALGPDVVLGRHRHHQPVLRLSAASANTSSPCCGAASASIKPTLNRFFSLHYLLPFVLVGVVFLHVAALHIVGSNNPLGIEPRRPQDTLPFHPYYTAKDSVGVCVFLIVLGTFVFFAPNFLGDPNNFIEANPLQTPADIVPEVVLPAVLRHPALGAEQAAGRLHDVRLAAGAAGAAVARHVPGAQRAVPADLSVADLALGRVVHRPRHLRRAQAGGRSGSS